MDIFWAIFDGYIDSIKYSLGGALIALALLICGTFLFFWFCKPTREPDSAYKRMKNSPAGGFIEKSAEEE